MDGNATNCYVLEQSLECWGMRPDSVEDGPRALETLRAAADEGRAYALAILDYNMPAMDGLAVARAINADPAVSATRLVLLTSSGHHGEARSAREVGIDAFLTKPVRQSPLYDCLATVLGLQGPKASAPMVTDQFMAEARSRSRAHVLVVEDNVVNQKVAARMLEKLGYRVDVAANGREALDALSRLPYAAVLMDCQMPEMDGYEATRAIRRLDGPASQTPVIAMTAGAMEGDEEKALAAGMDDFVAKPVKFETLASTLERWLTAGPDGARGNGHGADQGPPDDDGASLDRAVLEGLRELEEDGEGVGDLVDTFLDQAGTRIEELRSAVAAGDGDEVARVAHSLKGSSANLGARGMADMSAELEAMARGEGLAGAPELMAQLVAEFARVQVALPRELSGARG